MRVTLRTKSSHSDAIDIGASCRLPSASPASRRLSTNPIIVEAPEDLMTEVKALIAAADGPAAGSSLRKAAYASEASTRLEPGMDTRRLRALCGRAPRPDPPRAQPRITSANSWWKKLVVLPYITQPRL